MPYMVGTSGGSNTQVADAFKNLMETFDPTKRAHAQYYQSSIAKQQQDMAIAKQQAERAWAARQAIAEGRGQDNSTIADAYYTGQEKGLAGANLMAAARDFGATDPRTGAAQIGAGQGYGNTALSQTQKEESDARIAQQKEKAETERTYGRTGMENQNRIDLQKNKQEFDDAHQLIDVIGPDGQQRKITKSDYSAAPPGTYQTFGITKDQVLGAGMLPYVIGRAGPQSLANPPTVERPQQPTLQPPDSLTATPDRPNGNDVTIPTIQPPDRRISALGVGPGGAPSFAASTIPPVAGTSFGAAPSAPAPAAAPPPTAAPQPSPQPSAADPDGFVPAQEQAAFGGMPEDLRRAGGVNVPPVPMVNVEKGISGVSYDGERTVRLPDGRVVDAVRSNFIRPGQMESTTDLARSDVISRSVKPYGDGENGTERAPSLEEGSVFQGLQNAPPGALRWAGTDLNTIAGFINNGIVPGGEIGGDLQRLQTRLGIIQNQIKRSFLTSAAKGIREQKDVEERIPVLTLGTFTNSATAANNLFTLYSYLKDDHDALVAKIQSPAYGLKEKQGFREALDENMRATKMLTDPKSLTGEVPAGSQTRVGRDPQGNAPPPGAEGAEWDDSAGTWTMRDAATGKQKWWHP